MIIKQWIKSLIDESIECIDKKHIDQLKMTIEKLVEQHKQTMNSMMLELQEIKDIKRKKKQTLQESRRAYYQKNKEKALKYKSEYYSNNRDKILIQQRQKRSKEKLINSLKLFGLYGEDKDA